MATPNPNVIYRSGSSSPLTWEQMDGNFAYLSQSIANISSPESSSYAATASYVASAETALYVDSTNVEGPYGMDSIETSVTASYILAADIDGSTLGNYVDDTAAAAGGVPLYGLYRNGNIVLIRIV